VRLIEVLEEAAISTAPPKGWPMPKPSATAPKRGWG
jgi:hypothetical protein